MSVWRAIVAIATVAVLLAPVAGCNSDTSSPSRIYSVTYSLSITGNQSTVTVLTYRDSSGIVTVNNPTNGWSVQVTVSGGTTIGMTSQGTVNNGTIQINLQGNETTGNDQVTGQDSCTAQGVAVACSLAIPDSTLPS